DSPRVRVIGPSSPGTVRTASYRPSPALPLGVDPSQAIDCAPGCIDPEASVVTTCEACRRSSCASTGAVSVKVNVAESSVPSPLGEITGDDTANASTVRSTVKAADADTVVVA